MQLQVIIKLIYCRWPCKAIPFFFSAQRRPTNPDFRVFKKKSVADGNEGNDTLFQTIFTLI